MAQADLLVDLLKTATSGDQLAFRKAAEHCAELLEDDPGNPPELTSWPALQRA